MKMSCEVFICHRLMTEFPLVVSTDQPRIITHRVSLLCICCRNFYLLFWTFENVTFDFKLLQTNLTSIRSCKKWKFIMQSKKIGKSPAVLAKATWNFKSLTCSTNTWKLNLRRVLDDVLFKLFGVGSTEAIDLLSFLDEHESRHRWDVVFDCELLTFINIDLKETWIIKLMTEKNRWLSFFQP